MGQSVSHACIISILFSLHLLFYCNHPVGISTILQGSIPIIPLYPPLHLSVHVPHSVLLSPPFCTSLCSSLCYLCAMRIPLYHPLIPPCACHCLCSSQLPPSVLLSAPLCAISAQCAYLCTPSPLSVHAPLSVRLISLLLYLSQLLSMPSLRVSL